MYYLTDTDDHPEGWGGLDSGAGNDGSALLAIDYHTGNTVWKHEWPSGNGVAHNLTTAGNSLTAARKAFAFNAANGKILWHAGLMAGPSAGAITYMLDGKQYVLVAAGDSLYSFTVNQPLK
jgi:alcohol dehydrogenase (cytochrome c)